MTIRTKSPTTQKNSHGTITYEKDFAGDWESDAHEAIVAAEDAEVQLAYSSDCKSEYKRKRAGAYYTPADVADHFWKVFFERRAINTPQATQNFLDHSHFVEPAAGAGALFFSLIKALLHKGISPSNVSTMSIDLIDINLKALEFVRSGITDLQHRWLVNFAHVRFVHGDFLNYALPKNNRVAVFFGNPPFVNNKKTASKWKNLYADFVEKSLDLSTKPTHLNFILPLSVTFSRDYRCLRSRLRSLNSEISFSNYDNIPDTLFKSGKPKSLNTNKANSQRCSIMSVAPSDKNRIYSSALQRWKKAERAELLSCSPKFYDVSDYSIEDQIPRPASKTAANFLQVRWNGRYIKDLLDTSSKYQLIVSSVARNYIGFREEASGSSHILNFGREEEFLTALGVLSSRLFFEYWLTIGDGFHVTKNVLLNFPLPKLLEEKTKCHHGEIKRFWENRGNFEKVKRNSGAVTRSFDFSTVSIQLTASATSETKTAGMLDPRCLPHDSSADE